MGHACRRPDRSRSWAMEIAGCFDPEYGWHDAAQVWQTAGAGEEAVKVMATAPVEARVARFEGMGMTRDVASRVVAASDEAMARCILSIYRSAKQPAMTEWGKELPKAADRHGLVIMAEGETATGREVLGRGSAEGEGTRGGKLPGSGHREGCRGA